jgi:hypothetical protein
MKPKEKKLTDFQVLVLVAGHLNKIMEIRPNSRQASAIAVLLTQIQSEYLLR